jgi:hypothetical protein
VQSGEWAMSVLLSGLVKPFPDDWKFTGIAFYHNANEGGIAKNLDWTLLYTPMPIAIDMYGRVDVLGNDIGLFPWQFWNPQDLQNPDHNQVMIATIGQGQERSTPEQIKKYLEKIYIDGERPTLIVSAPEDFLSSIRERGLISSPSILSLKQLSGNDPAKINIPYYFDNDTGHMYYYFDIVDYNTKNNIEIWQYGFNIPLPEELQTLIWLAHFK